MVSVKQIDKSKKYRVNRARWQSLSIFAQMGNIGSEVGRTYSAKRRGDDKSADEAMARALDLFDATADTISAPRRKELLRAKEEFLANLSETSQQPGVENYFTQFAIAERLSR
jgi:hypothetical protein